MLVTTEPNRQIKFFYHILSSLNNTVNMYVLIYSQIKCLFNVGKPAYANRVFLSTIIYYGDSF